MGVSWFSLLAGEIISGQYGIGYFTWNAYSIINPPDIVVGMLTIGLLGASSTALVHLITRPALAWQRKARSPALSHASGVKFARALACGRALWPRFSWASTPCSSPL